MAGILWSQTGSKRAHSAGSGGSGKGHHGSSTSPARARAHRSAAVDDLCRAAQRGEMAAVTKLLDGDRKLSVNGIQPGRIPIVHAVAKNQWKIVRLLLDKNAKPNLLNSNGQAAIHIAADRGFADCVTMLLHGGADAKLQDRRGRTALEIAKAKERDDVCLVLETWPVLKRMNKRLQPLKEKSKSRDLQAVRQFLNEFNRRKAEIDKEIFNEESSSDDEKLGPPGRFSGTDARKTSSKDGGKSSISN